MLLLCAATRTEHDACAEGLRDAGPEASGRFELLLVGVGPARAGRSLRARLAKEAAPRRVISTGFAGALVEGVPLGAWVEGETLSEWTNGARVAMAAPRALSVSSALFPRIACDVVSADHLVGRDSPLRAPGASGVSGAPGAPGVRPLVADMESAALAREAGARGIPCSIVRLVSDTPEHPLPEFLAPFTAAMAGDGARGRLGLVARGVGSALTDPRGVARLLGEGRSWTKKLRDGVGTLARALASLD
ncbi:hypothetical protein [Pendulispora albinea]|uniref:Nucleoside phosphorylase domain-containing protein n=1 Tax=Pendulispora albinea TaxID=2741071 RepID=A0ABZ2M4N9_9BACT